MSHGFKELIRIQWHESIGTIGFAGWTLFGIVGVVLLMLAIAIVVMCLARRKQRALDDRRTAMDLLERGRLTPVRSKPLPSIPQPRQSGDASGSTRSLGSGQLAVDLSPHPFQQSEEDDDYRESKTTPTAPTTTAASIPLGAEISQKADCPQPDSPPAVKEPTPKTMLGKEGIRAMAAGPMEELQSDAEAPAGPKLAMDLCSPDAASEEFFKAQEHSASSGDSIRAIDKEDEPSLTRHAPRNRRADPGFNAASSLSKKPPKHFIGP